MEDQTSEEDDEEVVRVPEHFKVAASDDLHGGGDDEDERESDDDTSEAGDGGEGKVGGNLLRILRHKQTRELSGLGHSVHMSNGVPPYLIIGLASTVSSWSISRAELPFKFASSRFISCFI